MIQKRKQMRYQMVYNDLKEQIQSGKLPLGCRIAPENDLSQHYEASLSTIRKAVQLLCNEGFLCKRRPVGTFVIGTSGNSDSTQEQLQENTNSTNSPILKAAVLLPNITAVLPEGDYRHWQLYLRRLKGIFSAAAEINMNVVVYDLSDKIDYSSFDGLIIIRWFELFEEEPFNSIAAELETQQVPYVVISDYFSRLNSKWWVVDDLQIEFYNAYKFLHSNGMKKALVIGPSTNDNDPRVMALKEAEAELDFEYKLLEVPCSNREGVIELLNSFDAAGGDLRDFDTIFCATDLQALGAMDFALSKGLRIPEDINLMGCDNIHEGANAVVPLTTLEFTNEHSGSLATELLFKAIKNPENWGQTCSGRGKIIVRESVKILK